MDKLSIVLDVFKRYHFWFLAGGVLLIGLLCWWWAGTELTARFEARESSLDGLVSEVRQVTGDPAVPNETTIANIEREHRELKEHVLAAWELLYRQQKENNPIPDVLSENFREQFEALKPGQKMAARFLEEYRDFIEKHYVKLLRLVDRRHREGEEDPRTSTGTIERGGRTGGKLDYDHGDQFGRKGPRERRDQDDDEPKIVGTVQWDQPEIYAVAAWDERPTTQQVLLVQEDLWVYEALLRMIRNVNEGVESHDKAWIKRISALEIGRPAAEAWVKLQEPIFDAPEPQAPQQTDAQTAGPAGGPGVGPAAERGPGFTGGGGGSGQPAGRLSYGGEFGPGSSYGPGETDAPARTGDDLLDGRYVDEQGYPISAQRHREQPPYAEFKMMMVRMDLYMHQRHLADLMTECANSAMPVEVVRVRLNPGAGGPSELGGGVGHTGRGRELDRGEAPRGRNGPRIVRSGDRDAERALDEDQDYVDVEIFGIIYMYNRPDREKLGSGTAAGQAEQKPAAEEEPSDEPAADGETTPGQPAPTVPGEPAGATINDEREAMDNE